MQKRWQKPDDFFAVKYFENILNPLLRKIKHSSEYASPVR